MEGDDIIPGTMTNIFYFNPLPPHGGRHCGTFLFLFCFNISIHSLRMEGDVKKHLFQGHELDISIHSLRMEGDFQHVTQLRQYRIFQSTPSAWRETIPSASAWRTASISIHSLRMEGDHYLAFMILLTKYFNPLPPHGGRLYAQVVTWYIL